MARRSTTIDESDLERELLRKGVVALRGDCARCDDCGRTPLQGERLHHYAHGATVCELCSAMRPGDAERTELVRSGEHGITVRVTARAA